MAATKMSRAKTQRRKDFLVICDRKIGDKNRSIQDQQQLRPPCMNWLKRLMSKFSREKIGW